MEKPRTPRSPKNRDPILEYLRFPPAIRDEMLYTHFVETLAKRNDTALGMLSDVALGLAVSFYDRDTGPESTGEIPIL
jgi:hypothetical protein